MKKAKEGMNHEIEGLKTGWETRKREMRSEMDVKMAEMKMKMKMKI